MSDLVDRHYKIATMINSLSRKIRHFAQSSRFEQVWLMPLIAGLGFAVLFIRTLSFKRIAPFLGKHSGIAVYVPLLTPGQAELALCISRAVRTAARYTPWASNCFPQALVASLLLRFYGVPYSLYFGLARQDDPRRPVQAHAWIASGRLAVTGGESFEAFTVVGCFAWPAPGVAVTKV